MTEEAHLPPAAAASRAATPRIVAPPNTAVHSLANSEASSPRIMAEPPPGLRLPLPLLDLAPGSAQAESSAAAVAETPGALSHAMKSHLIQLCAAESTAAAVADTSWVPTDLSLSHFEC
jgi:hypothetical protein